MAIKLFSHVDLDGVSPFILLNYYYPMDTINYQFCNYNDINKYVQNFLDSKEYLNYEAIYITDISISEELAEKLEKITKETTITIRLFDHHATALNLNKFDFCSVMTEKNNELTCGTQLFYDYLTDELNFDKKNFISRYVKYVNDYDTWLWATKYKYDLPDQWNTLFYFYGKQIFVENVLNKFKNNTTMFSDTDNLILTVEANKKHLYIQNKIKDVFKKEIDGKDCVIVFAESYTNDIATALKIKYPNSDIQIIVGQKGISYRCRDNTDIDLCEFAKQFGGGGHPKAAGSSISKEQREKMIQVLFE